jgi:hypothetical protein
VKGLAPAGEARSSRLGELVRGGLAMVDGKALACAGGVWWVPVDEP